jgi:hypothetical protein
VHDQGDVMTNSFRALLLTAALLSPAATTGAEKAKASALVGQAIERAGERGIEVAPLGDARIDGIGPGGACAVSGSHDPARMT